MTSNDHDTPHLLAQAMSDGLNEDPNSFTTHTGIVFKLRPVSAFLIDSVTKDIPFPEVPTEYNPDKERDEPNPSSPTFARAIGEYERRVSDVTIETMFAMGTELVSVPAGVYKPEDTRWSDVLGSHGIYGDKARVVPSQEADPIARYALWVKYVALTETEVAIVTTKILVLGGAVSAESVQKALSTFPSDNTGSTAGGMGTTTNEREQRSRPIRRTTNTRVRK